MLPTPVRPRLFAAALAVIPFVGNPGMAAEVPAPGVRLNTVGYPSQMAKLATVSGAPEGVADFAVLDTATGDIVFEGELGAPRDFPDTREILRLADFSELTEPGRYQLQVANGLTSPVFRIGDDVLNDSLRLVMMGFYGQRCGMAVELSHDGETFRHGPCHLHDGYLDHWNGERKGDHKAGTGGWHDAGDYGKYVVNAGFANGLLLTAWEQFNDRLRHLELPIPESGDDMPDFLDELRYNLEWVLKMQFEDGRVSHKLTRLRFSPLDILPEEDVEKRYFSPWGTAANANFVASLAKAARVYEAWDPAFAKECREAAVRTWQTMQPLRNEVQPDLGAFRTGPYLRSAESDLLWAAVELFLTAPEVFDEEAKAELERRLLRDNLQFDLDWDWGRGANMGLYSYLFSDAEGRSPEVLERLRSDLLIAADRLLEQHDRHAYGRSLRSHYWGVNGSVARSTMNLHAAYKLTDDDRYLNAAFDQLAYLYGRNPYERSFVTGDGHNPPQNPHHRPTVADDVKAPWPGHLVGGGHPGELDWVDVTEDASKNENAINWDAALAYALAVFYNPSELD